MQPAPDEPKLETFGDRVRALREARELTVTETAIRVGVSRIQFHQWENGTVQSPSLRPIMEFAKLTDVSLDWLVNYKGRMPKGLRKKRKPKP